MPSKKKQTSTTKRESAPGRPSNSGPDLTLFRQLVQLVEGTDVMYFRWRRGDEEWEFKRGPASLGGASVTPNPSEPLDSKARSMEPALPASSEQSELMPESGHFITSPFVGTFYRTPAPEKPPFVELGTLVRKGQTICIVEAMKLMNEIEADVDGKVVEILVESGQPVEFGQALFRIHQA